MTTPFQHQYQQQRIIKNQLFKQLHIFKRLQQLYQHSRLTNINPTAIQLHSTNYSLILALLIITATYLLLRRKTTTKVLITKKERPTYKNKLSNNPKLGRKANLNLNNNKPKKYLSKSAKQKINQQQIMNNIPTNHSYLLSDNSNGRRLRTLILLLQYYRRFRHLNPHQLYREFLTKQNNKLAKQPDNNKYFDITQFSYRSLCKLIKKFFSFFNFLNLLKFCINSISLDPASCAVIDSPQPSLKDCLSGPKQATTSNQPHNPKNKAAEQRKH